MRLVVDKARPRPKSILSHVVMMTASVLAKTVGVIVHAHVVGVDAVRAGFPPGFTASHATRLIVERAETAS